MKCNFKKRTKMNRTFCREKFLFCYLHGRCTQINANSNNNNKWSIYTKMISTPLIYMGQSDREKVWFSCNGVNLFWFYSYMMSITNLFELDAAFSLILWNCEGFCTSVANNNNWTIYEAFWNLWSFNQMESGVVLQHRKNSEKDGWYILEICSIFPESIKTHYKIISIFSIDLKKCACYLIFNLYR